MCGRYALGIRAAFVRYQLQQQGMRVDEAPPDEEARETYNFPPGAYGLVYRADVPDNGLRQEEEGQDEPEKLTEPFRYQLKVMKWGLIPFWTKRSPDYGSMMRTINCRDDSLLENRGMWNTMKQRKRCVVIAQGFFEWLKKGPGGKEKIPHFVKRKDGNLMCFAGLWDCVRYEDAEEKLYTYTIITTEANKQLTFLHDRMPVILDPNTDTMRTWLDPTRTKWSNELQSLLQPYKGELECYPVNTDVGKVGNNSPDFIIPVNSKENKKNIANFFGNTKNESQEKRKTEDPNDTENHAPMPLPEKIEQVDISGTKTTKRKLEDVEEKDAKIQKIDSPPEKAKTMVKKTRSATNNEGIAKNSSPIKTPSSQRITKFFAKS